MPRPWAMEAGSAAESVLRLWEPASFRMLASICATDTLRTAAAICGSTSRPRAVGAACACVRAAPQSSRAAAFTTVHFLAGNWLLPPGEKFCAYDLTLAERAFKY